MRNHFYLSIGKGKKKWTKTSVAEDVGWEALSYSVYGRINLAVFGGGILAISISV